MIKDILDVYESNCPTQPIEKCNFTSWWNSHLSKRRSNMRKLFVTKLNIAEISRASGKPTRNSTQYLSLQYENFAENNEQWIVLLIEAHFPERKMVTLRNLPEEYKRPIKEAITVASRTHIFNNEQLNWGLNTLELFKTPSFLLKKICRTKSCCTWSG